MSDIAGMSDDDLKNRLRAVWVEAPGGQMWITLARYVRTLATVNEQPAYGAMIAPDAINELQMSATMIRTWIPEVFPADANGQVHFARAMMEGVADVIDRALAPAAQGESEVVIPCPEVAP